MLRELRDVILYSRCVGVGPRWSSERNTMWCDLIYSEGHSAVFRTGR